jgi:hypothetical protein
MIILTFGELFCLLVLVAGIFFALLALYHPKVTDLKISLSGLVLRKRGGKK